MNIWIWVLEDYHNMVMLNKTTVFCLPKHIWFLNTKFVLTLITFHVAIFSPSLTQLTVNGFKATKFNFQEEEDEGSQGTSVLKEAW